MAGVVKDDAPKPRLGIRAGKVVMRTLDAFLGPSFTHRHHALH